MMAAIVLIPLAIIGGIVGNYVLPALFPEHGQEMERIDRVVEFRVEVQDLGQPTLAVSDWSTIVAADSGEPPTLVKRDLPASAEIDTDTWMSMLVNTHGETLGLDLSGARCVAEVTDPSTDGLAATWRIVDQESGTVLKEGRVLAVWIGPDGVTVDAMALE
jgi:hypothetical protein